ncbi:MAG: DNA polymerase III subunit delta [Chloroflexi bacterium]|nr:DNA polymerase III subunit delta [Chloroflexota bacterium]
MSTAARPQLIYVLWGNDRFTRDEQVRGLKRRMLAEPFGEYNLSILSGDDVRVRDVRAVADALPFMGDRRLVVVEGLLGRVGGKGKATVRKPRASRASTTRKTPAKAAEPTGDDGPAAELARLLQELPPSTALVLVEDQVDEAQVESMLPAGRSHVRGYERPKPGELGKWIEKRAKHHNGRIEAAAIRQLALLAPEDLGMLDTEILKLVTYADGKPVTLDDVTLLSASPDVTIFGLLDAVGQGQRGTALAHLRQLFQRGERSEGIIPQIAGSLRRLIQAREMLDQGLRGPALASKLGVHPYVAQKTEQQARGYRIEQLETALRRLLKTDHAIKTGEAEPELALELFIGDLPRTS